MSDIKICGLKRPEDVRAVNEFHPDFVGFVFANTKRFVSDETAAELKKALDPSIQAVGVFVKEPIEHVVKLAADKVIELMSERFNKKKPSTPMRVLGPVKCSYGKINGKYRYRIIIKCKNTPEIREMIREIIILSSKARECSRINIYADMNGEIGV